MHALAHTFYMHIQVLARTFYTHIQVLARTRASMQAQCRLNLLLLLLLTGLRPPEDGHVSPRVQHALHARRFQHRFDAALRRGCAHAPA